MGLRHPGAHAVLNAGVAGQVIQDRPAVLLEGLPGQDLREEIRGVMLGADMRDGDNAGAAQLAHLKHLILRSMWREFCAEVNRWQRS